jgi:hypothetical protein
VAFQFLHIESYARASTKKGDAGSRSMRSIIGEALREDGECGHVADPAPPTQILGLLGPVEREGIDWAEQAKDSAGRKIKADGQCLLAGVISAPRDDPDWAGDWEGFKAASVDWLKAKYGLRLRAVVEHTDESHPHLHFYCVAKAGERFDTLHEGRAAMAEAKRAKQPKGVQAAAFAKAMRATQDDFHEKVGARFGMLRLGAGKRRLSNAAHKAEKAQAAALVRSVEWAEREKRAALALADQAKAEADAADARRVEAKSEADAVIAAASERAADQIRRADEERAVANKNAETTRRYKREAREERDEAREERQVAVKVRERWTRIGGKLGAFARGFRWAKKKIERAHRATVERLESDLFVKSVLANEAEQQLRKAKAENGIELAHERAERARREFEERRRFKPATQPQPGQAPGSSTPKPP